jgi:hypothetical protein
LYYTTVGHCLCCGCGPRATRPALVMIMISHWNLHFNMGKPGPVLFFVVNEKKAP